MKKIYYSLLFASSLFLISCGGGSDQSNTQSETSEDNKLAGAIAIDGSSTVFPITAGIAELFGDEHEDVDVSVGVSGTGGGFKKFCVAETDINDASRPIKEKESKVAAEHNIKYQKLDVAYDGIAVVVNKNNDWVDFLTVEELKKMWENVENPAAKWSDIREGWPEEALQLYGPGDASGTFDYFNEAIIGKEGSSRTDYNSSENDNQLVKGVADDKYALGYFGLAYYEENADKLKIVPVEGPNGKVIPSIETVMNKSYAPLSRPIFIYVSDAAVKRTEVNAFVNFYFDNVTEVAKTVGYIPLPENELKAQKELFTKFSSEVNKK